jgi:hypothetical protein
MLAVFRDVSAGDDRSQERLALDERERPQIEAVEIEQVENIKDEHTPPEPVVQRLGDDVDHVPLALERADAGEQLAAEHRLAEFLGDVGPDNEVGTASLIFQRNEDRAARRGCASPEQHEPGHSDTAVVRDAPCAGDRRAGTSSGDASGKGRARCNLRRLTGCRVSSAVAPCWLARRPAQHLVNCRVLLGNSRKIALDILVPARQREGLGDGRQNAKRQHIDPFSMRMDSMSSGDDVGVGVRWPSAVLAPSNGSATHRLKRQRLLAAKPPSSRHTC